MSMKKIVVFLSTYNGEKYLEEQIESIFKQQNVEVYCIIRDDGSTDRTKEILYKLKNKFLNMEILEGKNIGWRRSFYELVFNLRKADYYAFADQDDVWLPNKLERAVEKIAEREKEGTKPILYYSDSYLVNEKLQIIGKSINFNPPSNKETGLFFSFGQGCTMVFNNEARNLFTKKYFLVDVAHDWWLSILCLYFGEIIHDNFCSMYYRQHTNNVCGGIGKSKLILLKEKIKELKEKKIYNDCIYHGLLYDGYKELLKERDKNVLKNLLNYKTSFFSKLSILLNRNIRRHSIYGTILLKLMILFSKI